MPLADHPVDRVESAVAMLTHIDHQGSQDPLVPYSNQVRAMHWAAKFESSHCAVKPRMNSLQRAWVVRC
jgi:type VI secretion system secreted protein VgrG